MSIEDIKNTELVQSERDILRDDADRWKRMGAGSHLDDWLAYQPGLRNSAQAGDEAGLRQRQGHRGWHHGVVRSADEGRPQVKEAFILPSDFFRGPWPYIEQINAILDEYQDQGFTLSLRQLHYQYVARGLMSNTHKTYTYLGATLRDARMAGLEDWDAIEDRTRETIRWSSWKNPAHLIGEAAQQYAEDPWREHDVRLFSVRFGGDATHKYSGRLADTFVFRPKDRSPRERGSE